MCAVNNAVYDTIVTSPTWFRVLGSIVVSIPACHAGDRGSIPRRGGYFCVNFLASIVYVDHFKKRWHLKSIKIKIKQIRWSFGFPFHECSSTEFDQILLIISRDTHSVRFRVSFFSDTWGAGVCSKLYCYVRVTFFLFAKTYRCEQGSNLRGKIPLDFKSNALTTRPSWPDIF